MELNHRAVLDALDCALVCANSQGQTLFINQAAAAWFDCSREPLTVSTGLKELLDQLALPALCLNSEQGSVSRRVSLAARDGGSAPYEALITGVAAPGEQFYCILFRDISLELQMERAVVHARKNQALGALASGLAHDFNNILTGIISNLDLAQSPGCGDDPWQHLKAAEASARSGAELVKRLQLFGRESKGKFGPVDLLALVDEAVFMLRRSINPRIEIKFPQPKTKTWTVSGDAAQLNQVILNVAIGARHAMTDGGQLMFSLENVEGCRGQQPPAKPGDYVRVIIAHRPCEGSTGEVHIERILSSRNPEFGLAETCEVVSAHGGWVDVESIPGAGTRYSIHIPRLMNAIPNPPAGRSGNVQKPRGGKERLLVVDDEELVRMVIRAVLSYHGYEITEAVDGEDAIRKYAAEPDRYAAILMDLLMPRLDGLDALMQIRRKFPAAKAILLSGHLPEEHTDYLELKDLRFLPKPFDNQELLRVVREVLDGKPA